MHSSQEDPISTAHTNIDVSNEVGTNDSYYQPVPPPPYELSSLSQVSTTAPSTIVVTNLSTLNQNERRSDSNPNSERVNIKDYLAWSIINLVLGFVLGTIAVVLSLITRKSVRNGDLAHARKMSKTTLIVNIFITLFLFCLTAFAVVYWFCAMSFLDDLIE